MYEFSSEAEYDLYLILDSLERECSDVKSRFPNATSGVYIIYPDGTLSLAVAVYCYIDSNGDAWTVRIVTCNFFVKINVFHL